MITFSLAVKRNDQDRHIIELKGSEPGHQNVGCPPDAEANLLTLAWQQAEASATTLDRYLIDNEMISSEALYRALARVLELRFTDERLAISDHSDGLSLIRAEILTVERADPRPAYVMAPTGQRFEGMLRAKAMGLRLFEGADLTITTPRNFIESVRSRCGQRIAHDANIRLKREAPWLSAERIVSHFALPAMAAMVSIVLAIALCFPKLLGVAIFGVLLFPSVPSIQLKISAILASAGALSTRAFLSDRDLPTYTVLVPLYREARIVPDLIQRLKQIDYPNAKLEIKILVECDDYSTRQALEKEKMPAIFDVILCPPGEPRTKPRALNIGLAYAKGEYVVVYDAEDDPDPDQLRKAAAQFAIGSPRLGCVQARLAIDNVADSWIARMFALEYAGLFDGLLPGMSVCRQPVPLGGTSNHFRRSTLFECFGWDPWNVTEDADLGLRLARYGYQVAVLDSSTWEEAPISLKAWFNQRTRWLKGWTQTAFVLAQRPSKWSNGVSWLKRFEIAVISTSSVLSSLFPPLLLLMVGLWFAPRFEDMLGSPMLITLWSFSIFVFVSNSILSVVIWSVGAKRRGLAVRLADVFYSFVYAHLKSGAAWRALFEFLLAPSHWRKTEHGHAVTSRRRDSAVY